MAETKKIRLNKVLREFNISLDRAVEYLGSKGFEVEARPTTKISDEEYKVLFEEFQTDKSKKVEAKEVGEEKRKEKEELRLEREREQEEKQAQKEPSKVVKAEAKLEGLKPVGKIDLEGAKEKKVKEDPKEEKAEVAPTPKKEEVKVKEETPKVAETPKEEPKKVEKEAPVAKKAEEPKETPARQEAETKSDPDRVKTKYQKLDGPNFTGEKIDLSKFKKPEKKKDDEKKDRKGKRRRISKDTGTKKFQGNRGKGRKSHVVKEEPSEEEVQRQVRETLEKLQGKSNKGKGAKYRREKRDSHRQKNRGGIGTARKGKYTT